MKQAIKIKMTKVFLFLPQNSISTNVTKCFEKNTPNAVVLV